MYRVAMFGHFVPLIESLGRKQLQALTAQARKDRKVGTILIQGKNGDRAVWTRLLGWKSM